MSGRRRGRPAPAVIACLVASILGVSGAGAQFGPVPETLNLFQMVARSDLVVRVQVQSGSLKYAIVHVNETLKGTSPTPVLRIAFREFNFTRAPGEDAIVFPDGQDEILFLAPYGRNARRRKDREKNKDLYTLYRGRQGRMTVPAEGPAVTVEAIRRLSEVSRLDPRSQSEDLEGLLDSPNPLLLHTALTEIERLRDPRPALLTRLIGLLASASPPIRIGSLRVMAQIFSSGIIGDDSLDAAQAALGGVLERARNDSNDEVRTQAVLTMAAWPNRREVQGELKAIAGTDRAQEVRYEAERALLKP
ncbi:MAG TPA: hypothetical protein VGV60_11770 [Candidatus Polarisedimenticolia bacterium]|nr:hypothetical protein [Candidatus Polarisedimenticolia bacterium]